MTPKEAVDLNRFRVLTVSNKKTFRLIPSRFPPVDLYRRIAPPKDWPALFQRESQTNPRLKMRAVENMASTNGQNWNEAPFAYPKPKGTTFTRKHDKALVLFDTREAALVMSISQRTAFLEECSMSSTEIITRLLISTLSGTFLDLTDKGPLDPSPERHDFAECCRATPTLHGIAFLHPVYPHAPAYFVFDKNALGKSDQSTHFAYRWDGQKITDVFDSSRTNDPRESAIDINALFAGESVLAA